MANKKKIKCDCGNYLEEKITDLDIIKIEAMVCPNCNFRTLTKEQAHEYARIK